MEASKPVRLRVNFDNPRAETWLEWLHALLESSTERVRVPEALHPLCMASEVLVAREDLFEVLAWCATGPSWPVLDEQDVLVVVAGVNELTQEMRRNGAERPTNRALLQMGSRLVEVATEAASLRRRIAQLEAGLRAIAALEDPPVYHGEGVGAGLEDRQIEDRYTAAAYGWDDADERWREWVGNMTAGLGLPSSTEGAAT